MVGIMAPVSVAEVVGIMIPIPVTFAAVVFAALGFQFGRAFGKKLDYEIQRGDWFDDRGRAVQWLVRALLDFTHHWWIGALMMMRFAIPSPFYWFGFGLFIDDLPDMPRRFRGYFIISEELEEDDDDG